MLAKRGTYLLYTLAKAAVKLKLGGDVCKIIKPLELGTIFAPS